MRCVIIWVCASVSFYVTAGEDASRHRDESARGFGVARRSYVCGARSSNGADSRVCSRTVQSSGGAY